MTITAATSSPEGEVHTLGQTYDVLAFKAGCEYCHELQARGTEEVVKGMLVLPDFSGVQFA